MYYDATYKVGPKLLESVWDHNSKPDEMTGGQLEPRVFWISIAKAMDVVG